MYIPMKYFYISVHFMVTEPNQPNPELQMQLVKMIMSFGKYKDRFLCDKPLSCLKWFHRKGFPKGKPGIFAGDFIRVKRLCGSWELTNCSHSKLKFGSPNLKRVLPTQQAYFLKGYKWAYHQSCTETCCIEPEKTWSCINGIQKILSQDL